MEAEQCGDSRMKVFITGVAGFLGSHLANRLLEEGHEVVGCDNLLGGYIDNVHECVEFYPYDCNYHNSMVKITKNPRDTITRNHENCKKSWKSRKSQKIKITKPITKNRENKS